MIKSGIDQQALIDQFAQASAQQAQQLRQTVYQSTLGALQGRELSLKNIRSVLASVTQAVGAGAAKSPLSGDQAQALLDHAVAGMDDALLKAVEANRRALGQLVERGADLRDAQLKKAVAELEKFEDSLLTAVHKAASGAGDQVAQAWSGVLAKLAPGGTQTGAGVAQANAQLAEQVAQFQSAVRASRSAAASAVQTLADSYTALVSGVLIGLSEALTQKPAAPAAAPAAAPPVAPAAATEAAAPAKPAVKPATKPAAKRARRASAA